VADPSLSHSNVKTSDKNVDSPNTNYYDANNRFGILKSQICMVGDRLDTDILFGQNGGCKTLLVLSGNNIIF